MANPYLAPIASGASLFRTSAQALLRPCAVGFDPIARVSGGLRGRPIASAGCPRPADRPSPRALEVVELALDPSAVGGLIEHGILHCLAGNAAAFGADWRAVMEGHPGTAATDAARRSLERLDGRLSSRSRVKSDRPRIRPRSQRRMVAGRQFQEQDYRS